ncbi:MAG: hypothetical protein RLY99_823, partial [Pseudomonadota bacterium]
MISWLYQLVRDILSLTDRDFRHALDVMECNQQGKLDGTEAHHSDQHIPC